MRNWLRFVGSAQSRSQWENAVETLESRTLLAEGASVIASSQMVWHGIPMDVRQNSWVLTFQEPLGRESARDRAAQVAASMGLAVDRIDVTARGRFANIFTRSGVTEAAAGDAVSRFGFLRQFEPDALSYPDLVPNDARYPEQWALNNTGQAEVDSGTGQLAPGVIGADMDAERAWNIATGSDRVVIAVIDTGIDIRHPDLAANIYSNPGEIPNNNVDDDGNGFVDDVNGWDFVGGQNGPDNDPADPVDPGHGTSVAGCIGAVGGNGIGVAGTAWNVSMMPLKIGGDGPGGLPLFAIIGALDYVTMMKTDFGVNIVATNNSYGALRPADFGDFDTAQEIAIQDSTDAGVLFVASAGNDSVDNDSQARAFPASYPNPDIIAVAATNNRDLLASFSNYGATTVDVGAPGEQVLTTQVGGGYRLIDGTSFSGPYTAGVVAMIASVNRFLTKEQIKTIVLNSVDVVPGLQGLVLTGGRVNLYKALLNAQFPGPQVTAITPGTQTAPVTEIRVSFSKDIDPTYFDSAGIAASIELRRSNSDNRFDANDIFINLADPSVATVTLTARELRITLNAPLSRDLHRLTLTASSFRDFDGRYLNGSETGGNDEVYDFNVIAFRGLYEPNDAISQATPIILNGLGAAELTDITIGDGLFETRDVDIFRVFASAPALITAEITARGLGIPSNLDSYLRLFDASGVQLVANDNFNGLDSRLQFFVPAAGQYYIGVSAFPNSGYNPILENSGTANDTNGTFNLFVQVQASASDSSSKANTTAVAIPATGSITSTISFTDGRSILDVNVQVNIQHTFVGDLRITLTGPSGQIVTLVNRRGGAGDDFQNTIFDDEATTSILAGTPPYASTYRPEQSLTAFDQTSAAGTWTLTIADLKAGDSGQLLGWSLNLTLANDVFGPFEVNDTNIVATPAGIDSAGSRTFQAFIGDGPFGLLDVDLFRFVAGTGTTITASAAPTSGSLDVILRLFDSNGTEVAADKRQGSTSAAITYVVANAGAYYVGVSGGNTTSQTDLGNDDYVLSVGGSGSPTDATGNYSLTLTVSGGISEGAVVLAGAHLGVGVNANGAIGFANPSSNGADATGLSFNGTDFLLRAAMLTSYYGASVDGFSVLNAADESQADLSVSIANESDFSNQRVTITGTYRNLGIRRVISFGAADGFISIDITLTNRSVDAINNLAWMEGLNPDQGYTGVPATVATTNNIRQSQPRLLTATAGGLTLALAAPSGGTFPVVGSFEDRGSVRDPFQIINTPFDPDAAGDAGAPGDLDMSMGFNLGSLPGAQSVSFRYFIFADTSVAGVVNAYDTMDAGMGGGHLTADPKTPVDDSEGFSDLPYRVYYPEGYANSRASTFLPIVNGNAEAIRVIVIARYERQFDSSGNLVSEYPPDLLYDSAADATNGSFVANRRGGITLTTPDLYAAGTPDRVMSEVVSQGTMTRRPGVRKDVPYAIEVRASAPVGAILSHYDFGIATGDSFTSQLNDTWLLGEGTKGAGINDFVTFFNPSDIEVKVTLTAYPASGGAPIQVLRTAKPHRRGGWAINDIPEIPDGAVAFKVDAEGPIVAALSHFNTNTAKGYGTLAQPGGGSTSGATGEGEVGVGAGSETIAIVNPTTASATVTFTFSFANGSSYRHVATVAGLRRGGFDVASLVSFPTGQPYAVSYTSTQPVGVNIASQTEGEEAGSVLAPQASTQWLFAEGFRPVGEPGATSAVTEYLKLYNPSAVATTIEITLNYNNGDHETFRSNLPSRAGIRIDIHSLVTGTKATLGTVEGVGSFYGVKVQSAVPIVAFAGHFDDFLGGGFGTLGTPLGSIGTAG